MIIVRAGDKYDRANEQQARDAIAQNDLRVLKKGRDIELAEGERLILRDTNGVRYAISVSTLGVVTATSL